MTVLQIQSETGKSGAASSPVELELMAGQCAVVQCNYEHGRQFIRSVLGEPSSLGIQALYRGECLQLNRSEIVERVGCYFLDDGLYNRMKVADYLTFWGRLYTTRVPASELLALVGLEGHAKVLISRLSYSEKRLLNLVRSLIHNPELVIWENPEQNLDLESCIILRKLINTLVDQGKAILVTCSTMEQAMFLSEHIYRLTEGGLYPVTTQDEPEASEQTVQGTGELNSESDQNVSRVKVAKLEKLMIKADDKFVFVDPMDIYYIESSDGLSHIHTNLGDLTTAWTLTELEDKLAPYQFYRCHRSYLVNLNHTSELITWTRNSYSLVLRDDKKSMIPMSKNRFEEIKSIMGL
ncbi:LytTR family transcriptional regulator DNA-binding domain-containing protein [Paenibacillus radicis (ex Gao et al. 2016)]|uniref:Transcriptional regulator n=1 Tax=Paenibacillus radicis (ex Gao et al. 2016) TaxID=1737354 RepID=A0A917H9R6_9BACL|nr:LytTR family transcriptional regulator DNA-binding domain-containing protein [Paenibacillus radicis (ex Gao et al. 2016)]GGG72012.1 transcriptional regulator [Paenibacillus radicis (ex Gao et al. 2016)]